MSDPSHFTLNARLILKDKKTPPGFKQKMGGNIFNFKIIIQDTKQRIIYNVFLLASVCLVSAYDFSQAS